MGNLNNIGVGVKWQGARNTKHTMSVRAGRESKIGIKIKLTGLKGKEVGLLFCKCGSVLDLSQKNGSLFNATLSSGK